MYHKTSLYNPSKPIFNTTTCKKPFPPSLGQPIGLHGSITSPFSLSKFVFYAYGQITNPGKSASYSMALLPRSVGLKCLESFKEQQLLF